MHSEHRKLNILLDQLVIWLNEHPATMIQASDQARIKAILDRLLKRATSTEKVEFSKEQSATIGGQEQFSSARDLNAAMTLCPQCAVSVKKVNLNKHLKKCKVAPEQSPVRKAEAFVSPRAKSSITISPMSGKKKVRGLKREYPIGTTDNRNPVDEKRLDQSRGTHVYRDEGRYGSLSSFDDYGDESFP